MLIILMLYMLEWNLATFNDLFTVLFSFKEKKFFLGGGGQQNYSTNLGALFIGKERTVHIGLEGQI